MAEETLLPLCSSRDMPVHFLGPSSLLASIVAEQDAALAELERVLDPEMKDLRLANGGIDIAVAGPMVERLAVAMTGRFRQNGAENYVEMGLNARTERFDRYCVTVQKYGALSPHQLRQADEDRASAAEAERDVSRKFAGLTWTVPDVDAWARFANEKGATGIRDRLNRLFRRAVTAEKRVWQLLNETDRAGQDALSAVEAENTRLRKAVERLLPRKLCGELIPSTPDYERVQIDEWICGDRWRAVPPPMRLVYNRTLRRYRHGTGGYGERESRLWRRLRRAVVEAAGGL